MPPVSPDAGRSFQLNQYMESTMQKTFGKVLAVLCTCAALLPLGAEAHGPSRQKVMQEVVVNAPAATVWEMLSDFCSIKDWHPQVTACEGSGSAPGDTRVITIDAEGSPKISEEMLIVKADRMTYKYKITETDNAVMPVTTYSAFVTVTDNGDGTSTVQLKGGFYRAFPNNDPPPELSDEAAVQAVDAFYAAGLAGIKETVEQ